MELIVFPSFVDGAHRTIETRNFGEIIIDKKAKRSVTKGHSLGTNFRAAAFVVRQRDRSAYIHIVGVIKAVFRPNIIITTA